MLNVILLLAGVGCAGLGGELFVRGSVGLAHWLRVAPGIIGATVAAFATSSPELAIAISSALAGYPQISLGDALGSNVVNVALILALALTWAGMHCPRSVMKRDFPLALLVPMVTGLLILDGEVSRFDGFLLNSLFSFWLALTIIEAHKERSRTDVVLGGNRISVTILACLVGLALLTLAGKLIVVGASGMANYFGIDEFIVGATIVAAGTSTPELATMIIAKLRGHDEIGLGTILGSNIFNGLLIVGVAATIHPIKVEPREAAVALLFGAITVALTMPTRTGFISRERGVMLLLIYISYLLVLVWL